MPRGYSGTLADGLFALEAPWSSDLGLESPTRREWEHPGCTAGGAEVAQGRTRMPNWRAGYVQEHVGATKIGAKLLPGAKKCRLFRPTTPQRLFIAKFRRILLNFQFSANFKSFESIAPVSKNKGLALRAPS